MILITPSQCRAARALLNWSQPELAQKCGVHVQTISAFEQETSTPTKTTIEKIANSFEYSGIEFQPNEGLNKKSKDVITYMGQAGFEAFMKDVYKTVSAKGGEVCVSNVDEEIFTKRLGRGPDEAYMQSMRELKRTKKFSFKILIREGDTNFIGSSYAEYRWVRLEYFHTVPFYVYGDKMAIMLFKDETIIHVVTNEDIANAQRIQFDVPWNTAKSPKM